jgi:hypothetical protein
MVFNLTEKTIRLIQHQKEADKSPVDEPKKVNKKPAPAPKDVDDDLSAIVDNWDD